MNIKKKIESSSVILKGHVNRYTLLGLAISIVSIIIASLFVSYQLTGQISLSGIIEAQRTNPAIWILNLSPFIFGYWGQLFCYGLVDKAETYLDDKTQEFLNISGDLESKLKYESNHDSLTNLPNARMLSQQINNSLTSLGDSGQLGVIIIKVNDFQNINYNYGTYNASFVLKQFADRLKASLMDSYLIQASIGLNTIARLHSDEFVLLLPRLKNDLNINELLANLLKLMTFSCMIDGINVNISASAGIAIYPMHGKEESELLNHASIAVYQARKEGRPYIIYSAEMEEDLTQNRILLTELKNAIEGNNLEIYYQPIVEFTTGKIISAESLVRFDHPQLGLLNAEKFIPLIEGTNLIQILTPFMLKGAINQLANWHQSGYPISVSVNLSAKDASDQELPNYIERLLKENNVSPEFLKLEFTERACLTDQAISKEVIDKLASMGVKILIDDFCSGYSSFVYLTNFPISEVKIEKSYVMNMRQDDKKAKIVEAIIKLTEILNIKAFAEGIVDHETLALLNKMGCHYGQGFYFSEAVSVVDFNTLLGSKMPKL